jgi:hypothetical protein
MFDRATGRNDAIRERLASVDQPTHPLRQQLRATRRPSRLARAKALIRLRFRESGATA